MIFLAGCQDEGMFTPEEETSQAPVNVSFQVKLGGEEMSRAIGDASRVNQLIVGVFQGGTLLETYNFNKIQGQEKFTNVTIPMFKNQQYDLAFWAQVENNGIYSIDNYFNINIDYSEYQGISLVGTESFEAFSAIRTGVTVDNPGNASIVLTRPFAQLNIAASEEEIFNKVNKTAFTINNVYTAYNPFSGAVGDPVEKSFSFTFSPSDVSDKQSTTINGKNYYYLASAYLLAPEEVVMIGGLYKNEEVYKALVFDELPLAANTRTNIYGNMIQQEVMQGWDGVTLTKPKLAEGHYIIDEPSKLAWLASDDNNLTEAATFLVTENLDMASKEIASVKLPGGSTFDGGGYTIKYFANSLFGDATSLTVQNLVLDNVHVHAASDGHVGVLVNTLTGSSTFTGVTIANSSATTSNGAAGGMIGYITNKEGETLEVTFSGCTATNNKVNGSLTSGVYVGRFRGYDNSETLTFSSCNESSATITGTDPYYLEGNEATWLAENDYSDYSGWLGNEEFYRGTINYGNDRFIPKWDGTAKVEPLKDGNTILIYSAFDLATLQGATPTAVTFKTNVDLGSHKFKPIYSVQTLEGENNTVYNLTVLMEKHDGMGAAFIQSAPTGKVNVSHKNLILIGADVKNYHDTSLYPAFGVTNDGGAGNAYGGIFISKANSCESYTIDNIHVKDSKLYAVCKMGGIIGQSVDTKLYMSNCSVDNCIIQNYKPNVPNYYVLGDDSQPWMVKGSLYINLLQWWYTNGEAGGLIGFLQNSDSDIDNCSVTNTQINCSGQDNKTVVANVYSENQFDSNNLWKANKTITAKGETTIAGRHVNQFIGDVVSYSSTEGGTNYTVDITNYTVSGNSYNGTLAESTNKYNHQYDKSGDKYGTNANLYCEVVGCAYYIGLDIIVIGQNLGHLKYYAGNVAFSSKDGQTNGSFTEASGEGDNINIAWTGGNFKITGALLFVRSEYPTEPARKDPEY